MIGTFGIKELDDCSELLGTRMFEALDHDTLLHVIEQGATPPLLLLHTDLMSEVFKHVDVPFALKLSCRATRAAAPGETETKLSSIVTSVKLLEWAIDQGLPLDENVCMAAAAGGHLDCLVWAREHGCDWDKHTCSEAAAGGHFDCLVWAREHGCKWDKEECENVATDPATLRWIKKQLT